MRGITRPCRHSLPPSLVRRWRSHLCGLCLTLRDEGGHSARILTGYDLLIPSVLVEAQMGPAETETAGRCPLRGMQTADVIPATHPGVRFAAGASLLNGAAGLEDKVSDRDVPRWTAPIVGRAASAARRNGLRLTGESGFEDEPFSGAARHAEAAESTGRSLDEFLAPAGRAGAALFAHTAIVAGRPENDGPLARAGDAFGRLVHLLDAVDDYAGDAATGRFNPLSASGTPSEEACELAQCLAAKVRKSLSQTCMREPELALALLGPVLEQAVDRRFRPRPVSPAAGVAAVMAVPAVLPAIFGGRRRWGRRYPPPYDPYYQGGYRYRRGPSCCDLLACDCCANMACNDCCGGDDDCCCCVC